MNLKQLAWPLMMLVSGCSGCDDDPQTCDPLAQSGCENGLVCERITGGPPACTAPLQVEGTVTDATDASPITGARVIALDVNGAPVGEVAITDAQGNYTMIVASTRNPDASPTGEIKLRADAATYLTFPSGVQPALPVDLATAVPDNGGFLLQSPATNIALLPYLASGTGFITGNVEMPSSLPGVLVVAAQQGGGLPDAAAITDRSGNYALYNLDVGDHSVQAYAVGTNFEWQDVTLGVGETLQVDIPISAEPTSTLSGRVQIVNPGAGNGTSIVLIVESTFDPTTNRGQGVFGLRAPAPGIAPNVTGDFAIPGVPKGDYVVLAGFEDDFLVRDPDTCIGGTGIVSQTIVSGQDVTLQDSFKITGALDVIAPGANGVETVGATPILSWVDDSSEDEYQVTVRDAQGLLMWSTTIPGVSGADVSVTYAGTPLEVGNYYQFRATSVKQGCELSQTEDLKGVFLVE